MIDLAAFESDSRSFTDIDIWLVVKSQDQVARRQRLIDSKRSGTIGRIAARETEQGLLVKYSGGPEETITRSSAERCAAFREPRGLARAGDGTLWLTEVNRLVKLNGECREVSSVSHPFFGFLHSVDIHPDGNRTLVVSSGYDALIEIDLTSGEPVWEWFAWKHGLDETETGTRLVGTEEEYETLQRQGFAALHVDPAVFGEQGLVTSGRAAHPSGAWYDRKNPDRVHAVLGRRAEVIEIDRNSNDWQVRIGGLDTLPHAFLPFRDGWIISNTMKGDIRFYDGAYRETETVRVATLPGKPPEMAAHEWLQATYIIDENRLVAVDANRGLVWIDLLNETVWIQACDPDWSIQQVLMAE